MPKNSINQMVKCPKKLINRLTKQVNMQKRVASSRWQSFGVMCVHAYYVIFQFPHACMYTFLPDKLQKNYKMFSMWLQNRDKTETQNALCNFSESPHMCRSPGYMVWCIMRLVHFAIYARLAVCSCECGRSSCLCSLGLYRH